MSFSQVFHQSPRGWIEVICGPMFSGKTEELLRKIKRWKLAKIPVIIFKPKIDTRQQHLVKSRNGHSDEAIEINSPLEIYDYLTKNRFDVVAIDEAQFFSSEIVEVVKSLNDLGINVIVSGLDTDFRAEPFGSIPQLLAIADKICKLDAVCNVCGQLAQRTQRIVSKSNETVLIGDIEAYEPRCKLHHHVQGKPVTVKTKQFKERFKELNDNSHKHT
ncbi:thymidine kinase [Mycoplasmoides pneumoniae]|uniref:thymidine kinase n=1 Tax=Mycoplasmoides pneumoniae TaxID=2104 RepID=UPI0024E0D14A|nr:thymidine kinase [Mycoplasmoides pneumoniae]